MLFGLASARNRVAVPAGVLGGIRRVQEALGVYKYSTSFAAIVAGSELEEAEAVDWLLKNRLRQLRYLEGINNGFAEKSPKGY